MSGRTTAIGRSLDVYYRDPDRTSRMDALNAQFVRPRSLAFDIGAHVGDRTASFLRLGARVVAAEPQPRIFRALRLIHGRNPNAMLLPCALGAAKARLDMHLNTRNPTVSTLSPGLVAAARSAQGWQGEVWDAVTPVEVTTLDALIAAHGQPDFVKIDVEGHELAVLQGLSLPLPALSLEFTTIQRDVALACIERLATLGRYTFNLSLGEEHRLAYDQWVDARALRDAIRAMPIEANSGDVFARLIA